MDITQIHIEVMSTVQTRPSFPDSRRYGIPHRPGVGQLGAATIMENHGTVILFDIIVCIIIFLCNHNPENDGFIGAATIIAETNRTMAFDGM